MSLGSKTQSVDRLAERIPEHKVDSHSILHGYQANFINRPCKNLNSGSSIQDFSYPSSDHVSEEEGCYSGEVFGPRRSYMKLLQTSCNLRLAVATCLMPAAPFVAHEFCLQLIASAWPHHVWFTFRIILPLVFSRSFSS